MSGTFSRDIVSWMLTYSIHSSVLLIGAWLITRPRRVTPAAAEKGSARRSLISGIRERVETAFSSLWFRFVDRVLSRSWEGLWSTLKLKMLHYNLCLAALIPA